MKYRYLGNSGLAVSTVCLGTMTFGQTGYGCDEETAFAILDAYAEQGGNFVDTADKYGDPAGTAERIIGRWLTGRHRDDFVLASKCFFQTAPDINARGLSRKHILRACDASLKRLGTDYIDLYQVHRPDPHTPLEETLRALETLVEQGKVRYLGLSDHPAWRVVKAAALAERARLTPFISGQFLYNLLKRDVEAEILPACADSGLGLLCWSPLSGGMLTGKYKDAGTPPPDSRMAQRSDLTADRFQQWREKSALIVDSLIGIADRHGVAPPVVALAWLLRDTRVASVIVGAKRVSQIRGSCVAGDWELPEDDWSVLDKLSRVQHPYPFDTYSSVAANWFERIR
jgi:1-deoxyxylulose-5-phosphate synthase